VYAALMLPPGDGSAADKQLALAICFRSAPLGGGEMASNHSCLRLPAACLQVRQQEAELLGVVDDLQGFAGLDADGQAGIRQAVVRASAGMGWGVLVWGCTWQAERQPIKLWRMPGSR
jgi:hypothetical protein